jgi:hypothetical protein
MKNLPTNGQRKHLDKKLFVGEGGRHQPPRSSHQGKKTKYLLFFSRKAIFLTYLGGQLFERTLRNFFRRDNFFTEHISQNLGDNNLEYKTSQNIANVLHKMFMFFQKLKNS